MEQLFDTSIPNSATEVKINSTKENESKHRSITQIISELGYMPASFILGIIEIPLLFLVQYLVLVTKISTPYETTYVITLSQLATILVYFKSKGLYVFDVPKKARALLLIRSVLHSLALIIFIKTMQFFNPMIALVNF